MNRLRHRSTSFLERPSFILRSIGAATATLLRGNVVLARMPLYSSGGLKQRFRFFLSSVPRGGVVVTVRLSNGTSSEVEVTRGSLHEIPIPPMSRVGSS